MHSSWFPKPFHKAVRALTFLTFTSCVVALLLSSQIWLIFLGIGIALFSLLMVSSFNIRSGLYIHTTNTGNTTKNQVAITFDDGPCPQTMEILELLDQYKVRASFFLIGRKAEEYKEVIKTMNARNHSIGNHSFNHYKWFPMLPSSIIKDEIELTQKSIKNITGFEPKYYRPPFGITNPLVAKALKHFTFEIIGWSVRSLDTVTHNPGKIMERIKKRIGSGSIILLHDTSNAVIPVLKELLVYCEKNNLKPVSLDEFLNS